MDAGPTGAAVNLDMRAKQARIAPVPVHMAKPAVTG
jgi:hypothetical protein